MEEGIKNKIILALAVLSLIFFISSISSCINSRTQKKERDKEMAWRMDLEEKITKTGAQNVKLEEKVKELNRLIEDEKKADEVTKKTLTQEQLVNKSLKEELEKVAKLKEKLEEDLKEALVSSGKKSSIQR